MDGPVFCYDDGGRAAAGYRGRARDCAARAIAIATGRPYEEIYRALASEAVLDDGPGPRRNHPRTGLRKATVQRFLRRLGWRWIESSPAPHRRHRALHFAELPAGRLIVALSTHVCAVIDGVIYDTYDCSRGGRRRPYGYWSPR
jgi:hypothetical protein